MISLSLVKLSPATNPDRAYLQATVSGNYVQNTGDALNLTPSSWKDPKCLGVVGPEQAPSVPPQIADENLGGYYAEIVPGTTLTNAAVRFFESEGAELAAGAYPAAITAGGLMIEVVF